MVPGVSRSAATIIGGLALGLKRRQIVEFSFLLAVPTMLAATGLDLVKNINDSNFLIIQLYHFKKLNFGRDKILIFLDNSMCKQIDIKTINLTKVAWEIGRAHV